MSLSRDAVAQWLWERYGDPSEPWESLDEDAQESGRKDADDLALRFKLPLDASGPGVTRCQCGHPVGEHRNGEDACRGQASSSRGMAACKCQKATALKP